MTLHTLPKIQVYSYMMSCSDELAVQSCPLLCLQRQLAKVASRLFTVGLYCVTITWQQIFKGSLQVMVVGVLPHMKVELRHLGS